MTTTKIHKSRVGIVSDLHLGVHTNSAAWHTIAINWAKWLRAEFKRNNIQDILFCGDWHHNRSEISVSTLQVSSDILEIFKEFNIIAIVGNHDIYYKHRTDVNSLSIFNGRNNITIVNSVLTLEAFDRTITFCPWNTSVNDIPKSDVVLGHFEIETFKMNAFKVCEEGLTISELIKKAPLIISGHFHLRHEKKFEAGTILYVGNPFQMDFGDAGNEKGYYILDLDNLEYTFTPNTQSPKYIKIQLSELITYGSITREVKDLIRNNIVKLKIDKNISLEDLNILTTCLNQLQPQTLVIEYDLNFNKIHSSEIDKDLSGIDIPQAVLEFVNLLDIEDKKDIIDYTLELYTKCTA